MSPDRALGTSEKYLYKEIREGKLEGYRDAAGKMRISYGELYAYMKNRG